MLPDDEKPAEPWYGRQREFPFFEQPVIDGVVTLRGLPVGAIRANQAILQDEEFTFPIVLGGEYGQVQYELKPGEVTKLEVTVLTHQQATVARGLQAVGGVLQQAIEAVQGN